MRWSRWNPRSVPNRAIKEPWSSFAATLKADRDAEKAAQRQRAEMHAKQAEINNPVLDEIKRRVPEFGEGYGTFYFPDYKERSFRAGEETKIEVSVEVMARLLGIKSE